MKVGDLVALSSYGKSRQYNSRLTCFGVKVGLVIEVKENSCYPYKVDWVGAPRMGVFVGHMRRELKFARL